MNFGTQLIGQTEKALNAILRQHLTGTGISEPQWVTLTLTVMGNGLAEDALADRVAGALKVSPAVARERLAELAAAGLVRATPAGAIEATERGRASWTEVRVATSAITDRLWGDLPEEDLTVVGRVLGTVLNRANGVLAAA